MHAYRGWIVRHKRKELPMLRKIIRIDEERCDGCGACAKACHEGAIEMIEGKARLIRENYCDGLGDCLPACPQAAISFELREAPAYDEFAARNHAEGASLRNWPVQIKLAPVSAPCFDKADLLVAADCTAYAYENFHGDFISGRTTIIGCPKLDLVDYSQKLGAIIRENDIKSITLTRMQVPCCGGLENAVRKAIEASGKAIPCSVVTITSDGKILK